MNTFTDIEKGQKATFEERHPVLNTLIGIALFLILVALAVFVLIITFKYIGIALSKFLNWLSYMASTLDAVIIVALITGAVSIVGFVINSIFSKIIDFKKSRQEYLKQKREVPYTEFISIVSRINHNIVNSKTYSREEISVDLTDFQQNLALWGSKRVVKKWIKFIDNIKNPSEDTNSSTLIDEIMNEMRKDMGSKRLKKMKLFETFANGIVITAEIKNKD